MNNHILFTHIPKTAGTSFRNACEEYFGERNTFLDYGQDAAETSKEILKYYYDKKDMYALSKCFSEHKHLFLSGHFITTRYHQLFDTINTITFIRDPVKQIISHYNHLVSHEDYKNSLETFIKTEHYKNLQARLLQGKSIELHGFIGLTDKYNESIKLINHHYDLDIKVMRVNENINKKLPEELIDNDLIELIKDKNQEDIKVYDKASEILDQRIKCYKNNKPYTHIFIHNKTKNSIRGCAYQQSSDDAIKINIYNKAEFLSTVTANSYRPGFLPHGVPRRGFIGFEFNWDSNIFDVNNLRCIVENTGQTHIV